LTPYPVEIERQMQEMYIRLSEKDKRLYAGVEALKLPYGGISYIAELFNCSRNTVMRGIAELQGQEIIPRHRNRSNGGGRKQLVEIKGNDDIDEVFLLILKEHTAGNPMDEKVKWTNLTKGRIAELLAEEGLKVSRNIIVKLLKKHGYVKRKPLKKKAGGGHVNRNAQFERIAELRKLYESEDNPVISVDTKKKELIGNLSRNGKIYTTETIEVYDHDFPSLAEGVAVPHTIYDTVQNKAYVTIGTSRDTSEFACDSIRQWWNNHGKLIYLAATSILMLMDGGGSNSSRHYIFKQDLQALADELGIEIRVAHYPPYTSKWNPVEHRVFPHITRAMQGIVLTSHELTKELIETTTTKAGLSVVAYILNKVYLTKRKVAAG
jgi:transposase